LEPPSARKFKSTQEELINMAKDVIQTQMTWLQIQQQQQQLQQAVLANVHSPFAFHPQLSSFSDPLKQLPSLPLFPPTSTGFTELPTTTTTTTTTSTTNGLPQLINPTVSKDVIPSEPAFAEDILLTEPILQLTPTTDNTDSHSPTPVNLQPTEPPPQADPDFLTHLEEELKTLELERKEGKNLPSEEDRIPREEDFVFKPKQRLYEEVEEKPDVDLPEGWIILLHKSRRCFYYHVSTGTCTWSIPYQCAPNPPAVSEIFELFNIFKIQNSKKLKFTFFLF
jgi:hypothetical protein